MIAGCCGTVCIPGSRILSGTRPLTNVMPRAFVGSSREVRKGTPNTPARTGTRTVCPPFFAERGDPWMGVWVFTCKHQILKWAQIDGVQRFAFVGHGFSWRPACLDCFVPTVFCKPRAPYSSSHNLAKGRTLCNQQNSIHGT